jgi:hypothetical protein
MPGKSVKRCSVRKLFKAIDTDQSGEITLTELKKAFKHAAGDDKVLTYEELKKSCQKVTGRKSSRRGGSNPLWAY